MLKGVDLTLMIGPAVPIPVPRSVLDALTSVRVPRTDKRYCLAPTIDSWFAPTIDSALHLHPSESEQYDWFSEPRDTVVVELDDLVAAGEQRFLFLLRQRVANGLRQ